MRIFATALIVLGACTSEPRSLGGQFQSRVATQAPTGNTAYVPPARIKNNTPKPEQQTQPPLTTTPPPIDPNGEETGASTTAVSTARKYSGGIGSNCDAQNACGRDATVCFAEHAYPGGECSKPCSRFCPDDLGVVQTFCVNDQSGSGGVCVAKCSSGKDCRDGYERMTHSRFNEPSKTATVCVPKAAEPVRSCMDTLVDILPYASSWTPPQESWIDCSWTAQFCSVKDPVSVPYIMNSISFVSTSAPAEYLDMSCRMAHTLSAWVTSRTPWTSPRSTTTAFTLAKARRTCRRQANTASARPSRSSRSSKGPHSTAPPLTR